MALQITDWILCLVRLTALLSAGTAWMLQLIAFPAEFPVHAQALYNFLEESSEVDQFTIVWGTTRYTPWRTLFTVVQQHRDWDHKTTLGAMKAQILTVCTDHNPFQKACCILFYFTLSIMFSLIPNTVTCSNGAYIGQLQKLHRLCYSSVGNEKV